MVAPGGAGVGFLTRIESSPYVGLGAQYDLVPVYVYEGEYAYLRSYQLGLKWDLHPWRLGVFLERRFEGTPYDLEADQLVGLTHREQEADVGARVSWHGGQRFAYFEAVRDATAVSHGGELRVGWREELGTGRLRLRPHLRLSWRNSALNNYFYGVSPAEVAPGRPAHAPGAGGEAEFDLYAIYHYSPAWSFIGGVTAIRRSSGVRSSSIVQDDALQVGALLGVVYDFSPQTRKWPEGGRPTIVRVFYGASSGCDMIPIITLQCTHTHNQDETSVAGYEIGRPLVIQLNDWPLDIAAFVGLVRHKEYTHQKDFWEVTGYIKAWYYGFPWSHRVNTRIGFGAGLSYAREIPFMEQRDQAARGRDTSHLLHYMAPTIDVSVGDIIGVKSLKTTYAGLGVSHRSGIFGSSQLFNSIDGGSNYIYGYVEASF